MVDTNKPEKKFIAGAISASIWENKAQRPNGEEGTFKTVTLQRAYKDKNNEWKNTQSLRANDLPKAALVLGKAYEFITMTGDNE